ncbi:MAG TPA: CoA pyrophosphatase [Leptospiraceae bacterium]|nr:CoA pyrophosphatase [Leptospiraceae bacterium]
MKIQFDKIKKVLANTNFPQISSNGLKISSVVLPFYQTHSNKTGILLTKRSEHLKSHAGQISFPGGKFDESDGTLLETALREWEEETGERRETLEIIGSYNGLNTGTGFHITPYISVYNGDFNFKVNRNEVDFMIQIELEELLHAPFYTIEWNNHPSGRFNIYYFDLPQGLLWGATCHILYHFLKDFCGYEKKPELVKANLHSPPFFSPPKKS